jgi:CRP-like cAMP-binding protein
VSYPLPDRCQDCPVAPECPFRVLPAESRQQLHAAIEARRYGPTSTLFHQGDAADGLYVVRSGLVRLLHLSPGGKAAVVQVVTTSSILGLIEAIIGKPWLLSAQAVEESLIDFLPRRPFVRLLLEHSNLAVELLIRVTQELADLQRRLCEATESPLRERLLHRLQEFAGPCGVTTSGGVLLDVPLTVQDLADSLGCTRQWTSRLLGDMEHEGLIVRRGRRWVLTQAALAGSRPLQTYNQPGSHLAGHEPPAPLSTS